MSASALTTVFTPPASCFNNQYTATGGSFFVKDIQIASSDCYPAGFHPLFTQSIPFSPGVCPSGYVAATESSYTNDATAALCCPSSWLPYSSGLGCSLSLSSPSLLDMPSGSTTASSGTFLAMHGVYVAWASSDLGSFTPASAPLIASAPATAPATSATTTVTSTLSNSASASTSPGGSNSLPQTSISANSAGAGSATATVFVTPSPSSTNNGLSTGAQAGIGVGVAVVGLALIALALWALLRRRRRRLRQPPAVSQTFQPFEEKTELPRTHKQVLSELSTEGGVFDAVEVDSTAVPAELEGSHHTPRGELGHW